MAHTLGVTEGAGRVSAWRADVGIRRGDGARDGGSFGGVDGGSGGGDVVCAGEGVVGGGEFGVRDVACGGFGCGSGSGDAGLSELANGDGLGGDPARAVDSGCVGVIAEELGCEVICG